MPRQSQKKMDESKKSIPAPDPDAIPPQIRQKDPKSSEGQNPGGDEPRLVGPAPFDSDDVAVSERSQIDYTIKITADMAEQGTAPRKVRVYADGIYDLFHPGHARQLMQAKNVFPKSDVYLLVGVCSDALTRANKGKTVMNEDDRYDSVRHCRYVDEVVRDAPWTLDDDFLTKHKIDFVAHDEIPYSTGDSNDIYAPLKAKGMFVATQRTEGVSTSDIVANIVKDYDSYIRRNLARGYSRKDLNVSFLRGQKLMLQNKVDTVKKETKDFIERKKDEYLHKWEETSKEVISAFLKYFGSPIDEFWNRGKRRITQVLSPQNSPPASPGYHGEDDGHEDEDDEDGPTSAKRVKTESLIDDDVSIDVAGTSASSSRTSPRKGRKRT